MGRLDVLVRAAGQPQSYLTWQRTGNQGNQWRKAVVDIPNVDEFQVGFILSIPWVTNSGVMSLSTRFFPLAPYIPRPPLP